MLALALLTTLAFLASLATAVERPAQGAAGGGASGPRQSRGELLVASMVILNAVLGGAIYALGLSGALTRGPLGGAVLAISVGLLLISWRRGLRPSGLLRAWRDVVLLPLLALWETLRARSILLLGLLFGAWFLVWMALSVYFAPCWRDWDGPWYHESMVGFTIQNHGFQIVTLPVGLQKINGYQRFSEMTQLWFAIFAGRPLVDAANVFFTPLLMGSVYLLTRRYSKDRVTAIGWAVAFLLMPGNARLLQSTMVDPHATALFVAAVYYASEPELRLRSAWLAILALTMAVGAKTFLLIPGFVLALLLLLRLIANRKAIGPWKAWSSMAFGAAVLTGMICVTHLRNYLVFHNPVWPDLGVDIPSLGIHWKGIAVFFDPNLPPSQRVYANVSFSSLIDKITAMPWTNWGDHTWQIADYGMGVSWLIVPLGLLVSLLMPFLFLRDVLWRRLRWRVNEARAARTRTALLLSLPCVVAFATTPAVYIGRYHTAMVGMLIGVLAWVGSHYRFRRAVEGLAFFAQMTAIMMSAWTPPRWRWWLSFEQMSELVRAPYPAREVTERFGSPIHEPTGLAREAEIQSGDVVAFDGISFVSLLWNNSYSNKVVWVDSATDPLGQADRMGAKWICPGNGTLLQMQIMAASSRWAPVGPLEQERFNTVYRRR